MQKTLPEAYLPVRGMAWAIPRGGISDKSLHFTWNICNIVYRVLLGYNFSNIGLLIF